MADSNTILSNVSDYIAAAAALGTAAFALVDASKAFFGGVSNSGFPHIRRMVQRFIPADAGRRSGGNMLPGSEVLATLRANWMNGTALAGQKAIAKSLIKLRLDEANAPVLAAAAGVDEDALTGVAKKLAAGKSLSQPEQDVFGRFDLILTALLDQGYQRADQAYRNWARVWAMLVALALAIVGAWLLSDASQGPGAFLGSPLFEKAVLAGLVATPIAPIAKDLTSGLAAGVKVAQALRK
jgi:hypothetical protein